MNYEAKSLEDIATIFDRLARMALDRRARCSTQKEVALCIGEEYAYTDAARILRQTKKMQAKPTTIEEASDQSTMLTCHQSNCRRQMTRAAYKTNASRCIYCGSEDVWL